MPETKFLIKPPEPYINFSTLALAKMLCFLKVKQVDYTEFMFLGLVERSEKNIFNVLDIEINPQLVSSAFVTTDDEAYNTWLTTKFTTPQARNKIRLHGHSHVYMAPIPSGTDTNFLQQMLDAIPDYFLQLIINKKGEYTLNLFDKQANVFWEHLIINTQIGDQQITCPKLDKAKINIKHKELAEYTCHIYKNTLLIGDTLSFDFTDLSFMINDNNIAIKNETIKVVNEQELIETLSAEVLIKVKKEFDVNKNQLYDFKKYNEEEYENYNKNDPNDPKNYNYSENESIAPITMPLEKESQISKDFNKFKKRFPNLSDDVAWKLFQQNYTPKTKKIKAPQTELDKAFEKFFINEHFTYDKNKAWKEFMKTKEYETLIFKNNKQKNPNPPTPKNYPEEKQWTQENI